MPDAKSNPAALTETPVLGLCRFSYPSGEDAMSGRIGGSDIEERCRILYDPKRLDERMFLFERVFLPPWRGQTDPNFCVAVLLGERFPEPYRSRLEAMVRDIPQIRLEYRREGLPMVPTCREITVAMRPANNRLVAEFRLDDDDAISFDYVQRVRAHLRGIQRMMRRRESVLLSFARGFYLHFTEGRLTQTPVMARYWTPGLTYFWPANTDKIFASHVHSNAWMKMASVVDPDRPMFIRSGHATNISKIAENMKGRGATRIKGVAKKRAIEKRFGINFDELARDWVEFTSSRS